MPTSKTPLKQKEQILEHLRSRSLTAGEALLLYGTFRLAARVLELRQEGHMIQTVLSTDIRGRRYARYYLEEADEEGLTGPEARLQEGVPQGPVEHEGQEAEGGQEQGTPTSGARGAGQQR